MNNGDIKEQILIRSLRDGNVNAFRTLYQSHAPRLKSFCKHLSVSGDEADEIVQETFIRIWLHRKNVNENLLFSTYIMTIAKRLIYNRIKQLARREKYLKELSAKLQTENSKPTISENELQRLIDSAIQKLPQRCKIVFLNSRIDGLSNREIAEKLSISTSTVENQINKALKIIRKTLEQGGYLATAS